MNVTACLAIIDSVGLGSLVYKAHRPESTCEGPETSKKTSKCLWKNRIESNSISIYLYAYVLNICSETYAFFKL